MSQSFPNICHGYGGCLSPPATNKMVGDPSLWLQDVIDAQAKWDQEKQKVTGIKDPAELDGLCPYGMFYDTSTPESPPGVENVVGGRCKDHYPDPYAHSPACPPNTINMYGQCLSTGIPPPSTLAKVKNLYLTWFNVPSWTTEKIVKAYMSFLIKFAAATQTHASKKGGQGINGICFPLTTFPDKNNMTWLNPNKTTATSEIRKNIGKWIVDNWITECIEGGVRPGILAYVNMKYNVWINFYSDVANGTKTLQNPVTGKNFRKVKTLVPTNLEDIEWNWGAFIHFYNNYVISQVPAEYQKDVYQQLWFHLDKEGDQAGPPEYMIYYCEKYIGSVFDAQELSDLNIIAPADWFYDTFRPLIETRLLLATGIGTPGERVADQSKPKQMPYDSISVPENYWGAGNQIPCGGDPGATLYARTACTSLHPHRRLRDRPQAFNELISGNSTFQGSGDAKGWLGGGKWKTEINDLNKTSYSAESSCSLSPPDGDIDCVKQDAFGPKWIWPSFSIENLSLCDKDDDTCYSRYWQQKNAGQGQKYSGTPGDKTTLCLSMLFLDPNMKSLPPSQGTKGCGTFDGFSFWTWDGFSSYLNSFASLTENDGLNMVVYEANFIPYHWIVELGLEDELKSIFTTIDFNLLPPSTGPGNPESICKYLMKPGGCKEKKYASDDPKYCDSACTIPCSVPGKTCGTPSPTRSPHFSPTRSPHSSPTRSPHFSPTRSPHFSPTRSPHFSPTHSPHLSPTHSPHLSPTRSPHFSPTRSPHSSPTRSPHFSPTRSPHSSPTGSPHFSPTGSPHFSPTGSPHFSPTRSPHSTPGFSPVYSPGPISPSPKSHGLSTAAIAGIIAGIGVLLVVSLVVVYHNIRFRGKPIPV